MKTRFNWKATEFWTGLILGMGIGALIIGMLLLWVLDTITAALEAAI
jgi:Mg/Co/Ni transporter MgtE